MLAVEARVPLELWIVQSYPSIHFDDVEQHVFVAVVVAAAVVAIPFVWLEQP